MKSNIFLLAILLLSLISCHKEKEEDLRADFVGVIDPNKDPNKLSEVLGLNGTHKQGAFPLKQTSGLQITNYQTSVSASQNTDIYIPFTYDADNAPKGIYLHVIGAEERYWDIPISMLGGDNSYVFQLKIPAQVLSGYFDIEYAFYDSGLNTSQAATTHIKLAKPTPVCNGGCGGGTPYTESGEDGLTIRRLTLGNSPGTITVSYEMYSLPDRMDIKYNNQWVASTATNPLQPGENIPSSVCFDGQVGYVPGQGTLTFEYDPSKNKEVIIYMYGCYGGTAWDFTISCPNTTTPPDIQPYTVSLTGNNVLNTGIEVNSGDYVFFAISGNATLGFPPVNNGLVTFEQSDAKGLTNLSIYEVYKKYPNFQLGQAVVSLGNVHYGATNYTLKTQNCGTTFQNVQEYLVDNGLFINSYGDYFIANQRGTLMIDLNQKDLYSLIANFKIKIYVLTKDEHFNRNCFNKCPKKAPSSGTDMFGWKWDAGTPGLDGILENCYHGGMNDYRGDSPQNQGCQCVYDGSGNLYNSGSELGTFDYGHIGQGIGLEKHFILDVFPHIIYTSSGTYAPTAYTY